jgi:peptidoglycan/xylan/chitin deacetylase (PgdA/CDA1 family)
MLAHLITIDLDDVSRDASAAVDHGLEPFVDGILETLASSNTRATFFVPRHVAQTGESLLRRVSTAGHEVACLTTIPLSGRAPYVVEFREELQTSRQAIEDSTGKRVKGHRASGFGLDTSTEWAYDVLIDEGFEYDSSRLPVSRPGYGAMPVPQSVHAVRRWPGTLLEIPATTTSLLALNVQLATAPSIGRLPLVVSRRLIRRREARGDRAMIHLRLSTIARATTPGSAAQARRREQSILTRVGGLLGTFQFTSVENTLGELSRSAVIIES